VQACRAGTVESIAESIAEYAAAGARHLIPRIGTPELAEHADVAAAVYQALRLRFG
jgi:alkanesulfonate monooxygenase SsuD/methylene tetrahydromethanopterin reductase-like flavin-dependent oxidoreductase (luciferase family)